jgi:hypothetical protein
MPAHRFDGGMPDQKPYTHVRLILSNDGHINQRYEVRVSTFVQFDDDARQARGNRRPDQGGGRGDRQGDRAQRAD